MFISASERLKFGASACASVFDEVFALMEAFPLAASRTPLFTYAIFTDSAFAVAEDAFPSIPETLTPFLALFPPITPDAFTFSTDSTVMLPFSETIPV